MKTIRTDEHNHHCNECGAVATFLVPEDGEEQESYWCYMHGKNRIDARLIVHWDNPWEDAIPVPIEELVETAHGIGESWGDHTVNPPKSFIMTKEIMLQHWLGKTGRVDAYILPCVSGWHCIGVRYGNEGSQYLSPAGDKDKVTAMLRRYT